MLINIRTSEISKNSTESIPLGFIVSIAFFYPVYSILPSSKIGYIDSEINNVFLVSSNKWDTALSHVSDISSVGNLLYSSHAIWLILTGIILLMAMIGAIAITVNQERVKGQIRPVVGK
jgi:NADH:ubiquinone oxidoreductase subunit 6 (subunit J)